MAKKKEAKDKGMKKKSSGSIMPKGEMSTKTGKGKKK